jgi:autotransporter family porin
VKGNRNIGELKVGVEGQLSQRLQLWGNVAQQIGDNGYSDTQGMLGIKYSF